MMILPQSSSRISKLKEEGLKTRKALLKLMPDEFTSSQLAERAGIKPDAARAQVQKMVHWREIEPTSTYKTPRIYRKTTVDNSHTV